MDDEAGETRRCRGIGEVNLAAFPSPPEADLVALRASGAWIEGLSIVTEGQ